MGFENLAALDHRVIELAQSYFIRTHLGIVEQGDLPGGDGLPFDSTAERGTSPVARSSQHLLGLTSLLAEYGENATGEAMLSTIVDDRAFLAQLPFLDEKALVHAHAQMVPGQRFLHERSRRAYQSISRPASANACSQASQRN